MMAPNRRYELSTEFRTPSHQTQAGNGNPTLLEEEASSEHRFHLL